jgi:DNA-directed RNA polymerase specialized sigma24 family protein
VWKSFLAGSHDRLAFNSPQALAAFLARVAHHKVLDVYRANFETEKRDIRREWPIGGGESGGPQLAGRDPTPSQSAIASERWAMLLNKFPPGHRPVLERLRDGYTLQEVARAAGVSMSTVARIARRMKELCDT